MSDIHLQRPHGLTREDARQAAQRIARKLSERFALACEWQEGGEASGQSDVLHFRRSGVSGQLRVAEQDVTLQVRLGLLMAAFKPQIEAEVERVLDESFRPPAPRGKKVEETRKVEKAKKAEKTGKAGKGKKSGK